MVKLAKACLFKMAQGNLVNFDLFLPAVEMAINARESKLTGSTPFATMFGRPFTFPVQHGGEHGAEVSVEEMRERTRQVMECVYPAIAHSSRERQQTMATRVDVKRRAKEGSLPIGTLVMLEDMQRSGKSEPKWVGPYKVVEVSKAGTYGLLDSTGALLNSRAAAQGGGVAGGARACIGNAGAGVRSGVHFGAQGQGRCKAVPSEVERIHGGAQHMGASI